MKSCRQSLMGRWLNCKIGGYLGVQRLEKDWNFGNVKWNVENLRVSPKLAVKGGY